MTQLLAWSKGSPLDGEMTPSCVGLSQAHREPVEALLTAEVGSCPFVGATLVTNPGRGEVTPDEADSGGIARQAPQCPQYEVRRPVAHVVTRAPLGLSGAKSARVSVAFW